MCPSTRVVAVKIKRERRRECRERGRPRQVRRGRLSVESTGEEEFWSRHDRPGHQPLSHADDVKSQNPPAHCRVITMSH